MMRGTPRPTRPARPGRRTRGPSRRKSPSSTASRRSKLPCSFKAHSQATQRRWQHEAVLDLSAQDKAGICLDVFARPCQPVQPFDICLGDGKCEATLSVPRKNFPTGWNIIQVRKGQMVSQGDGPNLAAIRTVALVARKLESTNTVLHVADLRMLEADSMCPLVRPSDSDMLITKDGQIIDGTIVNDVYGINTAFGPFTLEARKVVGFAGVGPGTVRLLLTDGQGTSGLLTNRQIKMSDEAGKVHRGERA